MQYLLTPEEYNALVKAGESRALASKDTMQKLCTAVAIYKPIKIEWRDGLKPWGCILDEPSNPGYCDHCPVQELCPYDSKEWSK